ncbi:alkene reductase [Streptomyces sp. NPDC101225]|uniref:oxidoreductase n=1 Tax=Streptomyces sp. NPDC101225 TaxID=3366135 RepID=UPI0038147183
MTNSMDTTDIPGLFAPVRLGSLDLANRLVMAPMTRNRATADGVPTELMATYLRPACRRRPYRRRGRHPERGRPDLPEHHRDPPRRHVTSWRRITEAVREAGGGPMFLQIQHGGRIGHPDTSGRTPLAPSPIALPEPIHTAAGKQGAVTPRQMTGDDIRATIADFAAAARKAIEAGFAGVEVHSANGYLLHQFLAPNTNHRTDAYGGDIENRIRFTVEVVEAVAAEIGAERTGLRISPGNTVNGIDEGEETGVLYRELASVLADRGLAYLHVGFADSASAVWQDLRKLWTGTLIGNPFLPAGQFPADGGRAAAEAMLAAGADLVAVGRPFLANPGLVHRLRTGAPLNAVRDKYLIYVGGETGYTDYPA